MSYPLRQIVQLENLGRELRSIVISLQQQINQLQSGLCAVFSYPGLIAVGGLSGPFPVVLAAPTTNWILAAALGTIDSSNDVDITFDCNGTTFATLSVPAGDNYADASIDISLLGIGNPGDLLQVEIDAYAGSVASDLVVTITAATF